MLVWILIKVEEFKWEILLHFNFIIFSWNDLFFNWILRWDVACFLGPWTHAPTNSIKSVTKGNAHLVWDLSRLEQEEEEIQCIKGSGQHSEQTFLPLFLWCVYLRIIRPQTILMMFFEHITLIVCRKTRKQRHISILWIRAMKLLFSVFTELHLLLGVVYVVYGHTQVLWVDIDPMQQISRHSLSTIDVSLHRLQFKRDPSWILYFLIWFHRLTVAARSILFTVPPLFYISMSIYASLVFLSDWSLIKLSNFRHMIVVDIQQHAGSHRKHLYVVLFPKGTYFFLLLFHFFIVWWWMRVMQGLEKKKIFSGLFQRKWKRPYRQDPRAHRARIHSEKERRDEGASLR